MSVSVSVYLRASGVAEIVVSATHCVSSNELREQRKDNGEREEKPQRLGRRSLLALNHTIGRRLDCCCHRAATSFRLLSRLCSMLAAQLSSSHLCSHSGHQSTRPATILRDVVESFAGRSALRHESQFGWLFVPLVVPEPHSHRLTTGC